MPWGLDSELLQNFVIQFGKYIPIDSPFLERIGILAEAELF